jgi:haloalkane dehalogenase
MFLPHLHYRDWYWQGWRIRYAFVPATPPAAGDRTPMIFIHGFGVSGNHWRANLAHFSQDRPVYALDLLGFGGSSKPAHTYSIGLWVEQLYQFWCQAIAQPVVLVGNSLGALVVAIAASRYPEMVRGIVTLSLPDIQALEDLVPAPVRPLKRALEWVVLRTFGKLIFAQVRRPSTIRSALTRAIYVGDRTRVDRELIDLIAEPARDPDAPEAFIRLSTSLSTPGYSPNLRTALGKLRVPVLLIWGTKDYAIPYREAPRLLELMTYGHLVTLEGMGHCPHDEVPDHVHREMRQWLMTQQIP